MDRHLNIFYAYRQGSFEDAERESVLEDNVTRALIIALRSSPLLTQNFLEKFTGVKTDKPYHYDLQSRLAFDETESVERKRLPGRCVIVIAEHPAIPRSISIPNAVMRKFESHVESNPRRIRNALARLSTQVQEQIISEDVDSRLRRLLEVKDTEVDGVDLSDSALPFYLYQLTFGSRPDAWVTSNRITAVFENKLHGGIADAQIRRHIRENFGDGLEPRYFLQKKVDTVDRNQVPVVLWSWRDVYAFFNRFRDEQPRSIDPESCYIIGQFLEYLEVIGMGTVKFTQDDFFKEMDEIALHDRIRALGDELAGDFEKHCMVPQKRTGDYLGVNILRNDFKDKGIGSDQVPHWSCALAGKFLCIFISCESKALVTKFVKQQTWLEPKMTDALWEAQACSLSGLRLRVGEKLHIVAGGKGRNESVRNDFASFPVGAVPEQGSSKFSRPPGVRCYESLAQLRRDEEEGRSRQEGPQGCKKRFRGP